MLDGHLDGLSNIVNLLRSKKTRLLILILISGLCASVISAQSSFAKKDTVIPKFNFSLTKFEDIKAWQGRVQYGIGVTKDGDSISVGQDKDWMSRGLPNLIEYVVREINVKKGKPSEIFIVSTIALPAVGTKYESTGAELPRQIRIEVAPDLDPQIAMDALLFKGTSVEFLKSGYFAGIQDRFLPSMFKGPLGSIPLPAKRKLLVWAELNSGIFDSETLKEKLYFSVNTSQDVAYNTLQLNQAERAARQVAYSIKKLKEIFEMLGRPDGFEGIVTTATILSYDFVRKDDRSRERFQMYVPFDLLKRFSNLDITTQDLVDGSIILMDGSRIKVDLSAS